MNGRCVASVTGVVTAVLGSRNGQSFWFQDPVGDGNPATSQGLLVTAPEGLALVSEGDEVRIDGRVEEPSRGEELPVTRLRATKVAREKSGSAVPPPLVIGEDGVRIPPAAVASPSLRVFDPSLYAADAFESLEGMRVRITDPVVVGPTSRYGEAVVLADRGVGVGPRTARGGLELGDSGPDLERIMISDRLLSERTRLTVGDCLQGPVEGILHYTFGSYKILCTSALPPVEAGGLEREVTALEGDHEHLTVATFNLENLSALSPEDKLVALGVMVARNLRSPDILAVQEVQDDSGPTNDGTVTAEETMTRLTEAVEAAGGAHYEWRSVDPVDGADGGQPGTNIRTAFLFNPARVSFVDRGVGTGADRAAGPFPEVSPGLMAADAPAFAAGADGHGGTRKPLAGDFRFAGRRLVVVNLHLVSKGGDDPLFGRRQPPLHPSSERREAQAQAVGNSVRQLLEDDPGTSVIVLGDLNDFVDSSPLQILEGAGLEDLLKRLPADDRYTYVFRGSSQVLDHVLVSSDLGEDVEVDAVHLAAEFPEAQRPTDH
ncbi:MAG: endonuclease/exonuclease/phosphatase family protein, partial [Acidobacteriota bacterium]